MLSSNFKIFFLIIVLFLIKCSSEDNLEILAEEEEILEAQISSCVDYTNVDSSDLMSYWNLFVEDVKCSRGGPDYGEINTIVNLKFDIQTPEEFASGVSPDHAGYSTFAGYCNREAVIIGVILNFWEDYTEIQQLWLMYHEFGHDVYKYEHSQNRTDIMYPSIPRGDTKINDFIKAKNRFLRRDFPGISYIECPGD
ncbi:MAG: hypothetical protein ACI914_001067 [Candidatus Marivariicella framensis]|jgi:hypothetical protein|tara:strand:- start:1140 stop:1727 length:588 start_codon:yes stop_codon:yes gene_type:complete